MSERTPPEHQVEPEIIPPERGPRRSGRPQSRVFISIGTRQRHGRSGMPGLLGIILIILVVSFLAAALLTLFLGALLIAIPMIAALVAGLLVAAFLRRKFSWLRGSGGGSISPEPPARRPPEPW